MTDTRQHHICHPRPFEDGHALTFTVREIYDSAGEFQSQYHDRAAAAYAFGLARRLASYAEIRDTQGRVIATYARGHGTEWHPRPAAPDY